MRPLFLILSLTLSVVLWGQTVSIQTKGSSGTGVWSNRTAKLISLQTGFVPVSTPKTDMNKYGSWTAKRENATGYFYTQKVAGRWWFVDPDGYLHINIAVNSVPAESAYSSTLNAKYDRLWELGYNGIGNFSANEAYVKDAYLNRSENANRQFSYTRRLNLYQDYSGARSNYYADMPVETTTWPSRMNYVFTFDPMFPVHCASVVASKITASVKVEKNLLGYFLDNELSFNEDQLEYALNMPVSDPAYLAALSFIQRKGVSLSTAKAGNASTSVKQEFASLLAERYYKVCDSIIKIHDPNHLTLGSRLNGRPRDIAGVVKACAKYSDVVSVNFYDKWEPNEQITASAKWEGWIDAPCIVGEFYVKGDDAMTSGLVGGYEGAGWVVKSQNDRGYFYQNSTLQLLESKNFVGWHYFKYDDDNKNTKADASNKGIFTYTGTEYMAMSQHHKLINDNVYQYLQYLDPALSIDSGRSSLPFPYFRDRQTLVVPLSEPSRIVVFGLDGTPLLHRDSDSDCRIDLPKGVYILTICGASRAVSQTIVF